MDNDLPKAIHESRTILFGMEVRVCILDDGRRIIHAEDFHKLLKKMYLDSDNENSR